MTVCVQRSFKLSLLLSICAFGYPNTFTFTREELLNIRQFTLDIVPGFYNPRFFGGILVRGTSLCVTWRRCRWGSTSFDSPDKSLLLAKQNR